MTLRTRLSAAFFLASATAVVLASLFFSRAAIRQLERQEIERLSNAGALLLPQAPSWLELQTAAADSALEAPGRSLGVKITMLAADGAVRGVNQRATRGVQELQNQAAFPEVVDALSGRVGIAVRSGATAEEKVLYVAHPVWEHGRIGGVLRLAAPMEGVQELEDLRGRYLVTGLAGALAATFVVAALLVGWLVRPMHRLRERAQAIADGRFDEAVVEADEGETGDLAFALQQISDSMASTIRKLESERQVETAVLSALSEGAIAVSRKGTIVLANESARRLLGVNETLTGRDVFELFRQPEATSLLSRLVEVAQGGETEIGWGGPAPRAYRLSTIPITSAENNLAGLLVIADVTTYVTTLRMRRDFFNNASHELRTPLTSIIGYLETMEDSLPADSPLRSQYLDVLLRQAERMRRIVDDLLLLAQVESEQWPVRREKYDLAAQAAQVVKAFRPAAETNHQVLELAGAEKPVMVDADREKIYIVLSNLVDNAVKYAGPDAQIQLVLTANGRRVGITVQDDGPGIPGDQASRIFERFFRVDKSRSRALGGTGLGLSIVRHILAAHDEDISVTSEAGQGAQFNFSLPAVTS
jgi:two-component system phosphate regulon sensor histidine kinase PhoR